MDVSAKLTPQQQPRQRQQTIHTSSAPMISDEKERSCAFKCACHSSNIKTLKIYM